MQLTRLSRVFVECVNQDQLTGPLLDYGSPSGEIAQALNGDFADHRVNNCAAGGRQQHIEEIVQLRHRYASIVLTAQFDTGLNVQLVKELLSVLPVQGKLFVLLPMGYTLKPFEDFSVPWKLRASSPDGQILEFSRPEGTIDTTLPQACYTLLAGEKELSFCAGPGVFSAEGIDRGTRALLSTVIWNKGNVLDLGCGNGVIGLYAASQGARAVTLVDIDLRAIQSARENACNNGIEAEILACNNLSSLPDNSYGTVVSNPPYHSDYSVAKVFIEEGFKKLAPQGSMWMVVKNADWYSNKIRSVFGGVQVIECDGYKIVHAEKRVGPRKKPTEAITTTRKHARKMAASKNKRRM